MKILRLTTLLDFGGQEKQYISFTEKPELLKYQYVFAAIGYGGNAEKILKERDFEVHILNQNVSVKNVKNIYKIYQLIKKIKPDIIHTAAAEANFHGVIAAKLAGVKTIIAEEIGIPNHSSVAKKIFRFVYTFADQVVGVSNSVIKHLINIGEIPEHKGYVIYNPVSIPQKSETIDKDYFNIIYVGRLEKVKNVETLVRAFSHLKQKNLQLTIVGDGNEMENLQSLAKKVSLENNIIFTGFTDTPSHFLSNADLFVLPSFSEGFGIAAVEAMMLKIPVLCSNVGGIPEFIIDEENNGWLFNPKDENELILKLNTILSLDKNSQQKIAQKGYQSVIEKFTVEKYIHNLETFYNEFE